MISSVVSMEIYVESFHLSYGHERVFILVKCCCVLFIILFDHVHENFQSIWCQIPKSNVFESIIIKQRMWLLGDLGLRLDGTHVRSVPCMHTRMI